MAEYQPAREKRVFIELEVGRILSSISNRGAVFTTMAMRYAAAVLTLSGLLALILGLLFWIGAAINLISMHMLLGFLAVGALWAIGVAQLLSSNGRWMLLILALIVGALTIALGLYQSSLLVGASHWIVKTAHLLLGVLAIGFGHMLNARQRKTAAN